MINSQLLSAYSNATSNPSTDVYTKVSKIMQSQNTGVPKLNAALASDNTRLSGLGKLVSALSAFQSVAQSLSGSGLYASASSSARDVLTATASSGSASGSYAIKVTQLAHSQNLLSRLQVSPDAAIGSGAPTTLSFDFGSVEGNAFTPNAAKTAKSLVIPSGSNNLQGIAAAINAAKLGVTAKVTESKDGYALALSSPSGGANSLRIGVKGDAALQKLLAYDPAGTKNLTQTAAAQDAALTINGVALTSSSNILSKAVAGINLILTATGSATLTVARDATQFAKNVTNLVGTYNTLNASLKGLQQGDLKSDGSAARIQSQLSRLFFTASSGTPGTTYITPGSIGVAVQKNGELSIDAAKLQKALNASPDGVAKLFTNNGKGIADKLVGQIRGLIGPNGTIQKETATINKDIAALNAKKSSISKALTAQANALVRFYSQQGNGFGSDTAGQSSGKTTLFDILG